MFNTYKKFKEFSLKFLLLKKIYEIVLLKYEDLLIQLERSLLIYELNKTDQKAHNYMLN